MQLQLFQLASEDLIFICSLLAFLSLDTLREQTILCHRYLVGILTVYTLSLFCELIKIVQSIGTASTW